MNCDEYKNYCIEKAKKSQEERCALIKEELGKKFSNIEVLHSQYYCWGLTREYSAKICGHTFGVQWDKGSGYYLLRWDHRSLEIEYIKSEEDFGKYLEKDKKIEEARNAMRLSEKKCEDELKKLREPSNDTTISKRINPWWKIW